MTRTRKAALKWGKMERTVRDVDKISLGWQVWLTPRQTRIIRDELHGHWAESDDQECLQRLAEWFDSEAETQTRKLGANLTGAME